MSDFFMLHFKIWEYVFIVAREKEAVESIKNKGKQANKSQDWLNGWENKTILYVLTSKTLCSLVFNSTNFSKFYLIPFRLSDIFWHKFVVINNLKLLFSLLF